MRAVLLLLAALALAKAKDKELIKEDITIKGKGGSGPAVAVPPPTADRALLREEVEALDLYQREQAAAAGEVDLSSTRTRLARPFPEAPFLVFQAGAASRRFERWTFEVLRGKEPVWQATGAGAAGRLEWDGGGPGGAVAVRVGEDYRFRFSGWKQGEVRVIESDSIRLDSLLYKEFMGDQRLEVANDVLFEKDAARFRAGASPYLAALAGRMRRVPAKDHQYRLTLRDRSPDGAAAKARAKALARELARQLVIAPQRIVVERAGPADRGLVTSCDLPAEKGASLKVEP